MPGSGIFLPLEVLFEESVEPIIYLGMGLNVIGIAGLILLVFHPDVVRFIIRQIFQIANRIRPFRNPEKEC